MESLKSWWTGEDPPVQTDSRSVDHDEGGTGNQRFNPYTRMNDNNHDDVDDGANEETSSSSHNDKPSTPADTSTPVKGMDDEEESTPRGASGHPIQTIDSQRNPYDQSVLAAQLRSPGRRFAHVKLGRRRKTSSPSKGEGGTGAAVNQRWRYGGGGAWGVDTSKNFGRGAIRAVDPATRRAAAARHRAARAVRMTTTAGC